VICNYFIFSGTDWYNVKRTGSGRENVGTQAHWCNQAQHNATYSGWRTSIPEAFEQKGRSDSWIWHSVPRHATQKCTGQNWRNFAFG